MTYRKSIIPLRCLASFYDLLNKQVDEYAEFKDVYHLIAFSQDEELYEEFANLTGAYLSFIKQLNRYTKEQEAMRDIWGD